MNRNFAFIALAIVAIAAVAIWLGFFQGDNRPADNAPITTESPAGENPEPRKPEVALAHAKTEGESARKEAAQDATKNQGGNEVADLSTEVRGRVVTSESRQPVAGARIWIEDVQDAFRFFVRDRESAPEPSAVADAKGDFTIRGVKTGRDLRLKVEGPGRMRSRTELTMFTKKEKRDVGEISLSQAAQVEGRVTDSTGGPIAGAMVIPRRSNPNSGDFGFSFSAPLELEATTDSNGNYKIDGLAPNTQITVAATIRGRVPAATEAFEVKLGTPRIAPDIVLKDGKEVTGRVLDQGGKPVSGASVNMWKMGPGLDFYLETRGQADMTTTDAEGNFAIRGLDERNITINVNAPGKGSALKRNVAPGTRDVMIQLENLGTIRGRIVASGTKDAALAGAMLATARVEAVKSNSGMGPMILRALGDDSMSDHVSPGGEFEITGIEKGKYRVQVTGDSLAPAMSEEVEVTTERPVENLQIMVVPGAVLVVNVTKAGTGEPVKDAKVRLKENRPMSEEMKMFGDMEDEDIEAAGNGNVVTRSSPLPGGGVTRSRTAVRAARTVSVDSTSVAPRGAVGGSSPRGVRMPRFRGNDPEQASKPDPYNEVVKTDELGNAKFTGLPFAKFDLSAKADDLAPAPVKPVDLQNSTGTLAFEEKIAMSEGGALGGVVMRPDGEPAMGANVQIVGPEPQTKSRRASVDSQGNYSFEHLPAGAYHVKLLKKSRSDGEGATFSVTGADAVVEGEPVAIVDGKTAKLDLAAPALSVVTGMVTLAGAPLAGAKVSLTSAGEMDFGDFEGPFGGGGGRLSATTDANGKFKISDVEAGKYQISARRAGSVRAAKKTFEVTNTRETVDISIPRGAVEGRVIKLDGADPVAGATVTLIDDNPGEKSEQRVMMAVALDTSSGGEVVTFDGNGSVKTDSEGRYKIEDLPPGRYRVKAKGTGFREMRSEPFEVAENQRVTDVDVKLGKAATLVGRVTGPGGAARSGVLVSLDKAEGGAPKMTVSDAEGRFKFTSLDPGEYRLLPQAMGGAITIGGGANPKAVPVKLESGVETTRDLTVDQ